MTKMWISRDPNNILCEINSTFRDFLVAFFWWNIKNDRQFLQIYIIMLYLVSWSLFLVKKLIRYTAGLVKWISKWRAHGTLKRNVGQKILNSRRSRMGKIVTFWPCWQPFNSFYFETLFFLFATKKK